jgi:hypothetical protein
MVRHKTRWLLVRLDFEPNVLKQTSDGDGRSRKRRREDDDGSLGLTKKDLAQCIRDSIASCFGISAAGVSQDVQGKYLS